jgi:1-acyl-sn-glycerol-3-phosphate acyltransferase
MLRLVAVVGTLTAITLALMPLQMLALRFEWPLCRRIPVLYHRIVCALLGVRIREVGARLAEGHLLIAANHVSWLDIPVLTTRAPMVFVAKREVGTWPLFGLLARLQRSVFVDRERRAKTAHVNREIAARLSGGDPVVLFAEGTSSDGNRVLPFRSGLIGAAEAMVAASDGRSDAPRVFVQPLAIAYVGWNGLPAGRQHQPHLAWYGAMDLLPHIGTVIRHGAVDVVLSWGEPIACDGAVDRKQMARTLEAEVRRLAAAARRRPVG